MANRYLRDSQIIATGWIPADETWTYSSADSPIFVATVSGDQTSKYWAGQRVKLTQITDKYFIIHAVSYSAPNTLITLYGGTDYTLTSATITSPYYSGQYAPAGFPLSKDKWSISTSATADCYKLFPTAGTYYGGENSWDNGSVISLNCPIGSWDISLKLNFTITKSAALVHMGVDLCSNISGSNKIIRYKSYSYMYGGGIFASTINYTTTSKETHYLLAFTPEASVSDIIIVSYISIYKSRYI